MSLFESVLDSLHRETNRTDGAPAPVNFRHDAGGWLVWLGDGPPESSQKWHAARGETAMREAWASATTANDSGWWQSRERGV